MRLLSLLIFTVFLTTGSQATFGEIWSRMAESRKTTKECIIREVPLRIFVAIGTEYVRRLTNETVFYDINTPATTQIYDLYVSLANVTTWTESAIISFASFRQAIQTFQAVYDANPGQWSPEFPSYEGIYTDNVKERIQEIRQDLDDCYARTMPCQWSDFGCKFSYFVNGASDEDQGS